VSGCGIRPGKIGTRHHCHYLPNEHDLSEPKAAAKQQPWFRQRFDHARQATCDQDSLSQASFQFAHRRAPVSAVRSTPARGARAVQSAGGWGKFEYVGTRHSCRGTEAGQKTDFVREGELCRNFYGRRFTLSLAIA
jgi:hypothetical protein